MGSSWDVSAGPFDTRRCKDIKFREAVLAGLEGLPLDKGRAESTVQGRPSTHLAIRFTPEIRRNSGTKSRNNEEKMDQHHSLPRADAIHYRHD